MPSHYTAYTRAQLVTDVHIYLCIQYMHKQDLSPSDLIRQCVYDAVHCASVSVQRPSDVFLSLLREFWLHRKLGRKPEECCHKSCNTTFIIHGDSHGCTNPSSCIKTSYLLSSLSCFRSHKVSHLCVGNELVCMYRGLLFTSSFARVRHGAAVSQSL